MLCNNVEQHILYTLYVFAIDTVTFSCLWAAGMGSIGGGSAMGWLSVVLGAVAMGGSESGEHGIGVVKDVLLQISKRERDLMRQVKACFDPHGIMNPGKGY